MPEQQAAFRTLAYQRADPLDHNSIGVSKCEIRMHIRGVALGIVLLMAREL